LIQNYLNLICYHFYSAYGWPTITKIGKNVQRIKVGEGCGVGPKHHICHNCQACLDGNDGIFKAGYLVDTVKNGITATEPMVVMLMSEEVCIPTEVFLSSSLYV
jgi:D-arabinose 1-dehydrogenase-like Zn-dependent alcohol dehydrogenase